MALHEEPMSKIYTESQMNRMRAEVLLELENIYKEHGNVNIEVSYLEENKYHERSRRDTMWTMKELMGSLENEHDVLYFSDLEAPTEQYPYYSVTYHAACEKQNLESSDVCPKCFSSLGCDYCLMIVR